MNLSLKTNVSTFNKDVESNAGYQYTTNARYSSIVANERLTAATIELIPSNVRSIIDIGCGDGTYTNELKRTLVDVEFSGTDPAQKAVERASVLYPNIDFFVSNVLEPDTFPSRRYDMAIIRGVLHHLSDPQSAIKNAAKLADQLLIIEPNGNNPILKLIERNSRYHIEHEEQSFSSRTLRRWCSEMGWTVETLQFVGFVPFFFPTLPARVIHLMQPVLERIPVVRRIFSGQIVIRCRVG